MDPSDRPTRPSRAAKEKIAYRGFQKKRGTSSSPSLYPPFTQKSADSASEDLSVNSGGSGDGGSGDNSSGDTNVGSDGDTNVGLGDMNDVNSDAGDTKCWQ
jgi:hypothetical protein